MKKKYIAIAVVLLVVLLIQCVKVLSTRKEPSETLQTQEEKKTTITVGMWDAEKWLVDDDYQQQLEEKFGIELVAVDINYSNWVEQYQKLAAFDKLPDIVVHNIYGTNTYQTWVDQNLIQPIPGDLSEYPYLEEHLQNSYFDYFKNEQDELYCIPRLGYEKEEDWVFDRTVIVRKDWREQAGMESPESIEELIALNKKFMEEDYDENGKLDTRGIQLENFYKLEGLYMGDYPLVTNTERGWIQEDGEWIPAYLSKQMDDAIGMLKELWETGMLEETFPFQLNGMNNFLDEKSGILIGDFPALVQKWAEKFPDKKIEDYLEVVHLWGADKESGYRFTTILHWGEIYINQKVEGEKLQKILSLFNYLKSPEFKKELEEGANQYPSSQCFANMIELDRSGFYDGSGWYYGMLPESSLEYIQEEKEWFLEHTERVPYNWDVAFTVMRDYQSMPNVQIIYDEIARIILEDVDVETAWADYVETLKEDTALGEIIRKVNESS